MNSSTIENTQKQPTGSFTETVITPSPENIKAHEFDSEISLSTPSTVSIQNYLLKQDTTTSQCSDLGHAPELISDDAKDSSESEDDYMYDSEEEDEENEPKNNNRFNSTMKSYYDCSMQFTSPMINPKKLDSLNKGGFSTMGGLRLPGLKKMEEQVLTEEEDEDLY
ncbi:uncharacterized protein SAPINGB_P002331 [Magnusiomyces paraingens]|uniref:Uncharacterized protein n=1 Tax=Magnusiomyces paraingens TaxID=2606893 RepID=A0A5E8BD92_9ASCO|nr:uncharacterized protein SAPINGB_P002331 [Saprochaete ingens]VVT49563.1 unnamed protein product [Saprochaete ingens]